MRPIHLIVGAGAVAVALAASACVAGPAPGPSRTEGAGGTPRATLPPATAEDYPASSFTASTRIDNRWLPLVPGTQFVYEGTVRQGDRKVSHRVVMTVTDLTKRIDGVPSVVIWDRDYTAGQLVEGELAFFAQDGAGNVWLMGEYPEEYEDGAFAGAPDTWIVGLQGARPGIMMRADPRTGTSSYLQGWVPAIGFADRAVVELTGQRTCVPAGCYRRVLVIDEWNPDEPGAHQLKYYALDVGNVRVGFAGAEMQQEGLVLTSVTRLGAQELARARAGALTLERRAYDVKPNLYGRTEPARGPDASA